MRCEYVKNPLGIDMAHPRFFWWLKSSERGEYQTAYQILVASSLENLNENNGDKWDSGKVKSDRSVNVAYEGESLESGETSYWKVRVWDKDNNPSPWSIYCLNPKAKTIDLILEYAEEKNMTVMTYYDLYKKLKKEQI